MCPEYTPTKKSKKNIIETVTGPVYRVIPGSEPGNKFLVVHESDTAIVGVRKLTEKLSLAIPPDGAQTRIRVMPVDEFAEEQTFALDLLGFKQKGEHLSVVTTTPRLLVNVLKKVLA